VERLLESLRKRCRWRAIPIFAIPDLVDKAASWFREAEQNLLSIRLQLQTSTLPWMSWTHSDDCGEIIVARRQHENATVIIKVDAWKARSLAVHDIWESSTYARYHNQHKNKVNIIVSLERNARQPDCTSQSVHNHAQSLGSKFQARPDKNSPQRLLSPPHTY